MNHGGSRLNFKFGFTIVELLVVIVVIGILAAITIVSYTGITNRAIVSSLQSDLANASTALKLDQITNSAYPATLALANNGRGITPGQTLDNIIYVPDNTSNPNNFCLEYMKGTNTYAVDSSSQVAKGVCLQNLVSNGDFRNGTTGWGTQGSTISTTNDIMSVVGDGTNRNPNIWGGLPTGVVGHTYYARLSAMVTNSNTQFVAIYCQTLASMPIVVNTPLANTWYTTSAITTSTTNGYPYFSIYNYYADAPTASGKVMQVKNVLAIDLTASFGAGNEPTQAQMDTIMSNYPNNWFNIVAKANL